jgi:hypothetical protein
LCIQCRNLCSHASIRGRHCRGSIQLLPRAWLCNWGCHYHLDPDDCSGTPWRCNWLLWSFCWVLVSLCLHVPPRCGSCILHGGFNFCGHSGRKSIDKDDYLSHRNALSGHIPWARHERAGGVFQSIYFL